MVNKSKENCPGFTNVRKKIGVPRRVTAPVQDPQRSPAGAGRSVQGAHRGQGRPRPPHHAEAGLYQEGNQDELPTGKEKCHLLEEQNLCHL